MRKISAALLIGALTMAAACDDSPSSPSSTDSRFLLRLSTSAFAAPAVLITFSRIRAVRASGGSVDVAFPNNAGQYMCDVRRLQQSDGEIASGVLPAGEYSEVRVNVQSVVLYQDNPSNVACAATITAPSGRAVVMSGAPTEMVLSRSFRVGTGDDTTMRVALNSEQSFRPGAAGAYAFQPVVTVLSVN
jgi:hypothetical protein